MSAPTEDRMDRLETRVDKIEEKMDDVIRRIFEKLEQLSLNSVKNACPNPGACVGLSDELKHVIAAHDSTMRRVERFELKILEIERAAIEESREVERQFHKLERQKAWVLGAWSVVAFLAAIIGTVATIVINKYLP